MLNKEDILALAWEHSEGSGKRYIFTEENLFEFLKELKKEPATAQDGREAVEVAAVVKHDSPLRGHTEFMKYESWMADGLSRGWVQLMTVAQHERIVASLTHPAQKVNNVDTPEQKPIYLYRRKGQDAFATCDEDRFEELSTHHLFETKLAYAAPHKGK